MAKAITPGKALQLLQDNDGSFVECDLTGNATYSMKCIHFTKEIALALRTNTHLKRLTLSSLGISDSGVQQLAEALKENKALSYLNLSKNSFGSEGLVSLMDALVVNSTLLEIDLMGQTKPFGDSALARVIAMFNHNITLKHISWRLQSRQSFAINKLIVRNIEISKRLASGKSILDILPEPRRAEFGGDSAPVIEDSVGKIHVHSEPAVQHSHNESHGHEENHAHTQVQTPAPTKQPEPTISISIETKPKPQPQPQPAKPTVVTNTAQPVKATSTTGGRMLNRYLQAAQGTTDASSPSSPAPAKNFPTNSSSKRSFFEKQIEEQSVGAAKLNTRPQPIQRVTTHNPKASPPMVEQPPVHQTHQQQQEELDKPKHATSSSRVASIWKDKFENSNTNNTQTATEKNIISPRNRVQEMWSPRTESVKKTEVDPVQNGATKVASVWKNILDEEEKKLQEASAKVPAGKREGTQKQLQSSEVKLEIQPPEVKLEIQPPEVKLETQPLEVKQEEAISFKVEIQQVEKNEEIQHSDIHPDVDQSILIKYPSIGNIYDQIDGPIVFNLEQPENVVTIEIPSSD